MVRKDRRGNPTYFYWAAEFAIVLDKKDYDLLCKIRDRLDCGSISTNVRGTVRLAMQNIDTLLSKVIPFFEEFTLRGVKLKDFRLWKRAVKIIARNKRRGVNVKRGLNGFQKNHWNKNVLRALIQIQRQMRDIKGGQSKEWKWISEASTGVEDREPGN